MEALNSPNLFDDMDPRDLEPWKRSNRPRGTSSASPTEEEYLALCLIILARGGTAPFPPPSYDCTVCGKSFSSYQALGGHVSSHRKTAAAAANSASVRSAVAAVEPRIHECSVCGRCFPTGRALGGHKRRHYDGGGAAGFGLNFSDMAELGVDCGGKSQRSVESPLPVKKQRLLVPLSLGISQD